MESNFSTATIVCLMCLIILITDLFLYTGIIDELVKSTLKKSKKTKIIIYPGKQKFRKKKLNCKKFVHKITIV